MTIKEIGEWQEDWEEKLYKREYENLPDSMIDSLWDYFIAGGTSDEFNKTYAFTDGYHTANKLVEKEYKEFLSGQ